MVTEELAKMGERPANGPIVVCEWSGLPWTAHEFRRWWRQIANAAGIPKTVFNMDSRERRTRAGEKASDDDNSDHGRMGSDDHARRLIPKVAAALPKLLSDQVREDVLQEMLLDLHSGKISEAELSPKLGRRYISEYYKRYDNRYNTLSLDQPVLGKESGKLGDLISSDRAVWSEVP
jgi:hypothetical protein